jgi:hypothetical protein
MKETFESPKVEACEFIVAARLDGSAFGITGIAHSASPGGGCSLTGSAGIKSCDVPSSPNSAGGNKSCIS